LEVEEVGRWFDRGHVRRLAATALASRLGGGGAVSTLAAVLGAVGAVVLSVALAGPAVAAAGELTPAQQQLAADIDGKLIAPCCWTQTVALHESQKAEEIKMQVRLLVAQGKPESEIIDVFVGQYGEQILAAPRAHGFNWLAYLLPFGAIIVGLGAISVLAGRWRGAQPKVVPVPASSSKPAVRDEREEDLRRRLDKDLARFDS